MLSHAGHRKWWHRPQTASPTLVMDLMTFARAIAARASTSADPRGLPLNGQAVCRRRPALSQIVDLTSGRWSVLGRIANCDNARLTWLARDLGMHRQAFRRHYHDLLKNGFVELSNPTHIIAGLASSNYWRVER